MSDVLSGGSAQDRGSAEEQRASSWREFAQLTESCRPYLFDYCAGLLRDSAAAADAVRVSLAAAEAQFGQLPDPGRLQAWLYAIARWHCLSRPGRRHRTARAARDLAGREHIAAAETARHQARDLEAEARELETILVVMAALDGLSDRDRELLNLAFRHGFDDADLAMVVGIPAARAQRQVARASVRFGKSAAVVKVLCGQWARCEAWERLVGDADPDLPWLTPRLRKRLTRHINSCDTCTWSRRDMNFGPELLAAVPLAAPPAALWLPGARTVPGAGHDRGRRESAVRSGLRKDGFPVQPDARRVLARAAVASSTALVILLAAGVLIYHHSSRSPAGQRTAAVELAPEAAIPGPEPAGSSPAPGRANPQQRKAPVFAGAFDPFPAPIVVLSARTRHRVPAGVPASPPHHGKPSPSPSSPGPSPSASPTPAPSPSPSPSPPPSPSPSPSPPPSPSPSPPPSPSPSPSP